MVATPTYGATRDRVEAYFDRTATETWERLTSDAKVSGIRQTVREGRDRMRAIMLSRLPEDLTGTRVLDAGCGTGAMTEELARRGAEVVAIDISPQLVGHRRDRIPEALHGQITFTSGDMLSPIWALRPRHGDGFDDLLHRRRSGSALAGLARVSDVHRLHRRTAHAVPDGVLHRRKAVPAVRPVADDDPPFAEADRRKNGSARRNRVCFRGRAVSRGFYISTCLEYRA
jgi:magnesium-protoporphyrin O-methyltransferase